MLRAQAPGVPSGRLLFNLAKSGNALEAETHLRTSGSYRSQNSDPKVHPRRRP